MPRRLVQPRGPGATKLTAIGAPTETIKGISAFKDVGELIYSHLAADGTWNTDVMQTIKLT